MTDQTIIEQVPSPRSLFRTKPRDIEAVQFHGCGYYEARGLAYPEGVCFCTEADISSASPHAHVHTAHGQIVLLATGDWISPEPDGRGFYPIKPDIFEARYEHVDTLQSSAVLPSEAMNVSQLGIEVRRHAGRFVAEADIEAVIFTLRKLRAATPTAPDQDTGALSGSHASTEPCGLGPPGFDPARWQPIETAPKDGVTPVLAYRRTALGGYCVVAQFVHWQGGGSNWCQRVDRGFVGINPPTHWMPLPEPPASGILTEGGDVKQAPGESLSSPAPKEDAHD
jgi:hypothetical protein